MNTRDESISGFNFIGVPFRTFDRPPVFSHYVPSGHKNVLNTIPREPDTKKTRFVFDENTIFLRKCCETRKKHENIFFSEKRESIRRHRCKVWSARGKQSATPLFPRESGIAEPAPKFHKTSLIPSSEFKTLELPLLPFSQRLGVFARFRPINLGIGRQEATLRHGRFAAIEHWFGKIPSYSRLFADILTFSHIPNFSQL